MAAITWDDVVSIAAKLSTLPAGRQATILAYVNTRIPVDVWGGEDAVQLYEGRINLAAHLGTLAAQGSAGGAGVAGPVKRVTEGDVTVEFSDFGLQAGGSSLLRTTFGAEYRRLLRTLGRARIMRPG